MISFEVVDSFRYLGDSSQVAVLKQQQTQWERLGRISSLLLVLTNSGISLKVRGHVYSACIRSVLLYASETCAVKVDDIHRLVRNDNAIVRWICSAKLCEKIPMSDLRPRKGISSIGDIIRYNRFRWFDHLQRMDEKKNGSERS